MKLKTYRKKIAEISVLELAELLGVSAVCIRYWESDNPAKKRIPGEDKMREIFDWSNGAVQANDFYGLPSVQANDDVPGGVNQDFYPCPHALPGQADFFSGGAS